MHKVWVTGFAVSVGLAGWTNLAVADLFSAKRPVIAILADDLFVGEAEGHLSGEGTLAIHSQKNPDITCRGQFTAGADRSGSGEMNCSDGATATFSFQRLSNYTGYGVGNFSRGSMSFAYGLTAQEVGPYLTLPQGKRLMHNGSGLELISP
jgi:hypothetical protein